MAKAAYIRLNTPDLRKTLEEIGYTFSGYGDVQNATNICTTDHKHIHVFLIFLLIQRILIFHGLSTEKIVGKILQNY